MSNTNILGELQRETQWLRINRKLHQHGLRNQRKQIAALESELAAAIQSLEKLSGWLNRANYSPANEYTTETHTWSDVERMAEDMRFQGDWQQADELVEAWKARQPANQSTDAGFASIPPERADAVALVQQKHQLERAMLASRHERECRETEDWYQRAMNEALNSDENGI